MRKRIGYSEPSHAVFRYDIVMTLLCVIIIVFGGVWWLESRFGSSVAAMVFGGLIVAIAIIVGIVIGSSVTGRGAAMAVQVHSNISAIESDRMKVEKERAKIDVMQARGDLLEARRIDQLAQQRVKAITAGQSEQKNEEPDWHAVDITYTEVE